MLQEQNTGVSRLSFCAETFIFMFQNVISIGKLIMDDILFKFDMDLVIYDNYMNFQPVLLWEKWDFFLAKSRILLMEHK